MFERIFVNGLVPIFICVVLPVIIVWLIARVKQNETNRKTEIMLKAIEKGQNIDPDLFQTKEKKKNTSIKQSLLDKLTGACITGFLGVGFLTVGLLYVYHPVWHAFVSPSLMVVAGGVMTAVGTGLFISYFTGRKMLAKEIEAEEKKLLEQ